MNNLFPLASLFAGRRSFLSRDSSSTWDNVSNLRKKSIFDIKIKAFFIFIQQQSYHWLRKQSTFTNTHQHYSTSSSAGCLSQRSSLTTSSKRIVSIILYLLTLLYFSSQHSSLPDIILHICVSVYCLSTPLECRLRQGKDFVLLDAITPAPRIWYMVGI